MGAEFKGKGANVQLGPGVNLNRIPQNGRCFEYVSGEDPYLGRRMVGPVVSGIQSQGVIATAKHWVGNSQETDRVKTSSNIGKNHPFLLLLLLLFSVCLSQLTG
jgi:beta-glucosidase